RITKDQIFTLPVDPSTGYNNVVTNFGEVRNRGIELLVNTTPILTNNFRWDLGFNFAINKNKVLSMPESLEGGKVTIYSFSAGDDAVYMYAEEGKPMGSYYTFLPETYTDAKGVVHPVVNAYGQPVLSSTTLDTGRDMNHKWTGGVNTSLSAFGVTLSAQLDVRYGGTMFSRTKNLMQFTGNAYVTDYNMRRPFIIPNSVVSDGNGGYVENTTPIIMSDQGLQDYWNKKGAGQGGEYYLVDRTFAKLRNLSLTWELPKKWVNAAKLSNVAITLFGNNLFTWTARDNYDVDPESTTTGTDLAGGFGELYSNPSCRTFGVNLSIKY
ncbi:MAG: SusC/RagA family TonB-linked outer membrane protein, partial [Muribaculaceae bacterium]|nr:SusC/RagA family TonB-linked outer membrane protein [Muribaculaceae bacterium]